MSTSPVFSIAARVVGLRYALNTSRSTDGTCASGPRRPPGPPTPGVARRTCRAGARRVLLERVIADLLDVLLRHDPARARRDRAEVRHEVRNGACRWMRTRDGPTTSTSRTLSFRTLPTFERWKPNFTSSAVKRTAVVATSDLRGARQVVRLRMTRLIAHDSARLASSDSGIGFTSASWMA